MATNKAHLSKGIKEFTGSKRRLFVQVFDPGPDEPYEYWGRFTLGDIEQARGEADRIQAPSDDVFDEWIDIGEVSKALDKGSVDFNGLADRELSEYVWDFLYNNEHATLQVLIGDTKHPQNLDGWESKLILIHATCSSVKHTDAEAQAADDNKGARLTGTFNYWRALPVRKMVFTEEADALVTKNVLDAVYVRGTGRKRRNRYYVLQTFPDVSNPSPVLVSTDGGDTWTSSPINTCAAGAGANALVVIGDYLIALDKTEDTNHYVSLDDLDAGTSTPWVQLATGYAATKGPIAAYVDNVANTLVVAEGGYIYKLSGPTQAPVALTSGTLTTQDLAAIHGFKRMIVAVGGSNAVLVSEDHGANWSLLTGPSVGNGLTTVAMIDENIWLMGTGNGEVWYTADGGSNWTQINMPDTLTNIASITFEDNGVIGYMAADNGTTGYLYRTTDSGRTWHRSAPYLKSQPTALIYNKIVAAGMNTCIAVGEETAAGDGMVAIARPS